MSGPKNGTISLSVELRRILEELRADERRRRQAEAKKRRKENAAKLAEQASRFQLDSQTDVQSILDQKAEANRAELEQAIENQERAIFDELTATDEAGSATPAATTAEKPMEEVKISISESITPASLTQDKETVFSEQVRQEKFLSLISWKQELLGDEQVDVFCAELASKWQSDCEQLLRPTESSQTETLSDEIDKLISRAKQILLTAAELGSKFHLRNHLLNEIIGSLKEIGFVVEDPFFNNPNDPAGAVVLVASRGSEKLTTSVDLGDEIRSSWDHFSEDHCKSTFFQYLDSLQAKGIELKTDRPDLQHRPVLKQKGAKDLPKSDQRHA